MVDIAKDILIRARDGDLKSFEEVYRATVDFVYNVAWRVVNNREDAEEVTQEVFLLIYQKLQGFRFESSFKTWVYRMTVNCAINFLKRSARKNKTVPYEEASSVGSAAPETTAEQDREHHQKLIAYFLDALPAAQRACVVLRSVEGLSYQQIAEALGININTVRSRLSRARETLIALREEKHETLSQI